MAVFSGAIAAVGFAATVAGTAGATAGAITAAVASAVVAVSTAIGVAGLAVTAIGMITKNQDLMKAGKIMGYVGLAGGLAGGAIGGFGAMANGTGSFLQGAQGAYSGAAGHVSDAWDEGVGSWFSSDAASGVVAPVDAAPVSTGVDPATGNTIPSHQTYNGEVTGTLGQPQPGVQNGPIPAENFGPPESFGPPAPAAQSAPVGPGAPVAPTGAEAPSVADQAIAHSQGEIGKTIAGGPLSSTSAPQGIVGSAASKAADAFANMPDWMKMSMMTTGGQGVAGMASGYFAGASAEEKLEFEKLINAQRQGQVDLQNRNANYVPKLRFNGPVGPAGIINTAGRR